MIFTAMIRLQPHQASPYCLSATGQPAPHTVSHGRAEGTPVPIPTRQALPLWLQTSIQYTITIGRRPIARRIAPSERRNSPFKDTNSRAIEIQCIKPATNTRGQD